MLRILVFGFAALLAASYWSGSGGDEEVLWMALLPISYLLGMFVLKG